MREILFKAKRKDNGEWAEGYYLPGMKLPGYDGENDFIVMSDGDYFAINPITLCQYTGLTDKNGKKIWENDLLGHKLNRVEFLNGTYCINGDRSLFFEANTNEVIGNIFDNQEMLEVE